MAKATKTPSKARGRKRTTGATARGTRRRSDWEANDARIAEATLALLKELNRRPTYREIAARVGLHHSKVADHVKGFDWSKFIAESSLRALVGPVVTRLAEKLLLGELKDVRAREVRLFLEILVNYRSPTEDDVPPGEMPDVEITLPDNGRGDAPTQAQGGA